MQCATGQYSQAVAHTLEGKTILGMGHGHPPGPTDSYTEGPIISDHVLVDPKALICMYQVQRPVLDEGAGMHIDPWPDPGNQSYQFRHLF